MNFDLITQELVRALRAERSQVALSRRLKFQTNVLHAWERGRNSPTASQLLLLASRCGVDVRAALLAFYRAPAPWLTEARDPTSPGSVLQLLSDLRGDLPLAELARGSGLSRFALSRIFKGQAQAKAPDFLRLIQLCSRRVLDLVARFVNPEVLPSISAQWQQQEARRLASTQSPWLLAVLCGLDLDEYRREPKHVPGLLAKRLRISEAEERECLTLLEACGQITLHDGRYQQTGIDAVELLEDRERARARRAWWGHIATERNRAGHGMAAYNVCGVSKQDLQRIKELQREYLARVRSIVAESKPVESVAIVHVQIVDLTHVAAATPAHPGVLTGA